MYSRTLAILTPAAFVIAIFGVIYREKPEERQTWILVMQVIILILVSLILGFINNFALSSGLY